MIGRDSLVPDLEEHLRTAPGGCLGLWGLRGLGKSMLARALCSSLQREFPGRTCLISFPSLEQAARGVNMQQLKQQLIKEALAQLGVQLQPGAPAEQVCLLTIALCAIQTAPATPIDLLSRPSGQRLQRRLSYWCWTMSASRQQRQPCRSWRLGTQAACCWLQPGPSMSSKRSVSFRTQRDPLSSRPSSCCPWHRRSHFSLGTLCNWSGESSSIADEQPSSSL